MKANKIQGTGSKYRRMAYTYVRILPYFVYLDLTFFILYNTCFSFFFKLSVPI
jgi:hypothetical protein